MAENWIDRLHSEVGFVEVQGAISEFNRFDLEAVGSSRGISRLETLAIYFYTVEFSPGRSLFRMVNSFLRTGDGLELSDGLARDFADQLQAALRMLPPVRVDAFRRTTLPDNERRRVAPGRSFVDPGFLSSSRELDLEFDGIDMLVMLDSQGGRDVSALSAFPEEQEIVFLPGTRFTIQDVSRAGAGLVVTLVEQPT